MFDSLAMDAAATSANGVQVSPGKSSFDQKVEIRAERHEHLRGRKNVTFCRSPTRDSETVRIKMELKEKRHQDFLRRRPVSPEPPGVTRCRNCSSRFSLRRSRISTAGSLHSFTSNGLEMQSNAIDGQRSDRWVKLKHFLSLKTQTLLEFTWRAPAAQSLTIPAPFSPLPTPAGFMVVRKHNCDEPKKIYLRTKNS